MANWDNQEVTLDCSKGERYRVAVSMIGETHFYANNISSSNDDRDNEFRGLLEGV